MVFAIFEVPGEAGRRQESGEWGLTEHVSILIFLMVQLLSLDNNVCVHFVQKRIKAAEAESKLKQVYIPN